MNRLELALHGYRSSLASFDHEYGEAGADLGEAWLRDDVCPVVEELIHGREFRRAATWSLERFRRHSGTNERRLVDAAEAALSELAQRILAAMDDEPRLASIVSSDEREILAVAADRRWTNFLDVEAYFSCRLGLNAIPFN